MAGHSHSANIKFRKDRQDQARGKKFSKAAREIISAVREGGKDPAANLRLRYAIDRAKAISMPRDNIERAIKRGSGELEGAQLEELLYEGFAPGGVAVLVESLTDNRNRTAPEVRKTFEKGGGNLGSNGAVAWMFERRAEFIVNREGAPSEEELMELVLECGAEDLIAEKEAYVIHAAVGDFHSVAKGLEAAGIEFEQAGIAWIPTNTVEVTEPEKAAQVINLLNALEDLDDVQSVSANYDIPDEILESLEA